MALNVLVLLAFLAHGAGAFSTPRRARALVTPGERALSNRRLPIISETFGFSFAEDGAGVALEATEEGKLLLGEKRLKDLYVEKLIEEGAVERSLLSEDCKSEKTCNEGKRAHPLLTLPLSLRPAGLAPPPPPSPQTRSSREPPNSTYLVQSPIRESSQCSQRRA